MANTTKTAKIPTREGALTFGRYLALAKTVAEAHGKKIGAEGPFRARAVKAYTAGHSPKEFLGLVKSKAE